MIANLYVDHMMASPAVSSQDVWNATQTHGKLFSDAAARVGLTPGEYKEFRAALLDGKATYVRLPHRIDAMSGNRHGSVYAVKNAVLTQEVKGWRVRLADGNLVYVPQLCGNISLQHAPVVAIRPRVKAVAHKPMRFHQAVAVVPKEVPVIAVPQEAPELPPAAPTVANATVASAAGRGGGGFLFLIPAVVGGFFAGSHGGSSSAPPCQPPIATLSLN